MTIFPIIHIDVSFAVPCGRDFIAIAGDTIRRVLKCCGKSLAVWHGVGDDSGFNILVNFHTYSMTVFQDSTSKKNDYFKKDFCCFVVWLLYYFSMKVKVYFNLHRKLFSVVDVTTGKVIDHSHGLSLNDPEFRVQQGGRRRVLREQRKNVHAYIIGEQDLSYSIPSEAIETTYNPYKYNSFVLKHNEQPLTKAYKTFLQVKNNKGYIYTLL